MRLLTRPLFAAWLLVAGCLLPGALAQPTPQSCQGFIPGSYVFQVAGRLNGPPTTQSRSFGIVGVFRIDSYGNILYVTEDINSPFGFMPEQSATASCTNRPGEGQRLVLQPPSGPVQTFALQGNGLSYAGSDAVASGFLAQQDVYAVHSPIYGIPAIGLSGETACLFFCPFNGHPAGQIEASATFQPGLPLNGTLSATLGNLTVLHQAVTGYPDYSPSGLGRFHFTLYLAGEAADIPVNFVAYVVDANSIVILSADPHTTFALLTGGGSLQTSP